jgi:hypothetical protein
MSVNVFANGMEIACKAASGQSAAAFPDVCLSPPSPPAGPVPIPYPNTAKASDTANGSTTVMICDQEVMLKDQSVFKTSTGNEAATKSLGMGVVTHTIQGEASFIVWSMDVKFEGANVPRHMDMMVHNEQSNPANTAPWGYVSIASRAAGGVCHQNMQDEQTACANFNPPDPCEAAGLHTTPNAPRPALRQTSLSALTSAEAIQRRNPPPPPPNVAALNCLKARRCQVTNYRPNNCCPGQTADHVLPKASIARRGTGNIAGWPNYTIDNAPCVCAEGKNNTWGSHGLRHSYHKTWPPTNPLTIPYPVGAAMPFDDAVRHAARGVKEVFRSSGCNIDCLVEQLTAGHQGMFNPAAGPPPPVQYRPSGRSDNMIEVHSIAPLNA